MGYAAYLQDLLRPLGVYDFSPGTFSCSETEAMGAELDRCGEQVEYVERESILLTAQDKGLELRESLFAKRPVQVSQQLRREAIMALLRISADSFTLDEINRAISGCGIKAQAQETGHYGYIRIIFPDVPGIPEGFEQIKSVILDLIPCHLETEFYFRYITWAECERQGFTWAMVEQQEHTWYTFELAV